MRLFGLFLLPSFPGTLGKNSNKNSSKNSSKNSNHFISSTKRSLISSKAAISDSFSSSSLLVWENEWKSDAECQGPPTQMAVFEIDPTTNQATTTTQETTFYSFIVSEYALGTCGNLHSPLSRGCCYSSLDTTASNQVLSGSVEVITNNQTSPAPTAANGHIYCQIIHLSNASLSPHLQTLYFLGGGEDHCHQSRFKCGSDGVLSVYPPSSNCSGSLLSSINLFSTPQSYNISGLGRLQGQYGLFQQGQVSFSWIALTPSRFLVPNFKSLSDYLG
jgi:hypothetical protein